MMVTFRGKKPEEINFEDVRDISRIDINTLPFESQAQMQSVVITASEIMRLEEVNQAEAVERVRQVMDRVHFEITEKILETPFYGPLKRALLFPRVVIGNSFTLLAFLPENAQALRDRESKRQQQCITLAGRAA